MTLLRVPQTTHNRSCITPLRPPSPTTLYPKYSAPFSPPLCTFSHASSFSRLSFCRRRPLEGEGVAHRTTYTVLKTLATEKIEEEKKHNRSSTTNEDVYYVCTYPEIIKSHGWAIDPIRIDRY